MVSLPRNAPGRHQGSSDAHADPGVSSACGAGCLLRSLIVPPDLDCSYTEEERAAGRRYGAAVLRLALEQPEHRMVVARRAAVAALLAANGRDGTA